jgi:gamma-glutamylcyclotransferase (GGCT)/AIG2-like uncharacterized protein YtfP
MSLLRFRHVFVYGTLREGEQRDINRLVPRPRWMGSAFVSGVLYDLGDYPGLMLARDEGGDQTLIRGEVYEITAELERLLDEIEGVAPQPNGEYVKSEVMVVPLQHGAENYSEPTPALVCLVYEVTPHRAVACRVIEGGDWVAFRLVHGGHADF